MMSATTAGLRFPGKPKVFLNPSNTISISMQTTLVTVSGMSPAILTETLWALANETPPVIPDEVAVITTAKGESDIQSQLLAPIKEWKNKSVWDTLRADIFQLTGQPERNAKLQLSMHVIDLPDEITGVRRKAEDLRTRQHHDETANFIIRLLGPLCDPPESHVIASIAGGRKTMGALLYAAMSLVGKESDRATHVLVSDPFDTVRGFFYPQQPVQILEARPFGQAPIPLQASGAKIELADIPFVPLRNKFTELDEPRRTFAGLVNAYSRAERQILKQAPVVTLDVDRGILEVEGRPIKLNGRDLLIAAFLHDHAVAHGKLFRDKDATASALADFMEHWKNQHPFHQATTRLSAGEATVDDIPKALANLRKKLGDNGLPGAIPYLAPERSRIGFEIRS